MRNKNSKSLGIAASLVALFVTGCSDTSATGAMASSGNGTSISFSLTSDIQVNSASNVYMVPTGSCDSVGVFSKVFDDTTHYLISGGKLYTWKNYDCMADVYTGSSATLQGRWTSQSKREPIPGKAVSQFCDTTSTSSLSWTSVVTYTSSSMSGTATHNNFCWATETAQGDSTMVANGCNEVLKTKNGKTATLRFVSFNQATVAFKETFTYAGKTCTVESGLGLMTAALCHEAYQNWQAGAPGSYFSADAWAGTYNSMQYRACIAASGWSINENP